MNEDIDWSGSWPKLVFPGGFRSWLQRRLLLGLEVAALIAAIVTGTAAKMAGYESAWFSIVALACIGVLTRLRLTESSHAQHRLDRR